MKLIDMIVKEMIEEHEGGEKFFDNLDQAIQQKPIVQALVDMIPNDRVIHYIIVSGKFGRFFSNYYNDCFKIISVAGGLRKGNRIDDLSFLDLEGKRVVFIDDSFYLGRTRDAIKEELERNGATLAGTVVAYDGSKEKDSTVKSLYRYYDNYKEEEL